MYFNEYNSLPHRAFGEGFFVSSISEFVSNDLTMFDVPFSDLKLISETKNEKYANYIYTQTYNGLEVLDSRFYVKTKLTNEVVVFGLDVFPDISLSINSTVSNSDAILSASSNLPFSVSESRVEDKMKILPIPTNVKYEYHLVKVVHLSTKNYIGPAEYLCYVDANTGELLMRQNDIESATRNLISKPESEY